jgi:poly-gamma-glutamate capsule biosynthesis protein CapA/YwtB (metallophosphatase superfamily)
VADPASIVVVLLAGDVMTGRGIDQILPHPGDPTLAEPAVRDAREYVALAERVSGSIPRPVGWADVWGDALDDLRRPEVDVRIVNLETSITSDGAPWPGKGIHYRMHPANVAFLQAAHLDCSCLANNHVLDWGHVGLVETLRTLDTAGLVHVGAGTTLAEAAAPAVVEVPGKGRVLIVAAGATSSGIPEAWRATNERPGVNLLPDLSAATAQRIADQMQETRRPDDVIVASIHWGDNWGYDVPEEQIAFAHRLIDGGVTIVHGHSSHHPKRIEVYHQRLILYGCGDFVDDYEGISGYEEFRRDLAILYRVSIEVESGDLTGVQLLPFQIRRFRLHRVIGTDARWLAERLNRLGLPGGPRAQVTADNNLTLWI